jgi:hypothetical protein
VLSDPAKRAQHDRWIKNSELGPPEPASAETGDEEPPSPTSWPTGRRSGARAPQDRPTPAPSTPPEVPPQFYAGESQPRRGLQLVALIAAVVVCFSVILSLKSPANPSGSAVVSDSPRPTSPIRPRYIRPPFAPDGQPWPSVSGYLTGYAPAATRGQSELTIDNTQNGSDVCAALFEHRFEQPRPVRVFFLRAHEQLRITNISSGSYDVRYQDLDSGATSESEVLRLVETAHTIQKDGKPYTRTEWTVMRLTLFTVPDGNTRFETVGPAEFWDQLVIAPM